MSQLSEHLIQLVRREVEPFRQQEVKGDLVGYDHARQLCVVEYLNPSGTDRRRTPPLRCPDPPPGFLGSAPVVGRTRVVLSFTAGNQDFPQILRFEEPDWASSQREALRRGNPTLPRVDLRSDQPYTPPDKPDSTRWGTTRFRFLRMP